MSRALLVYIDKSTYKTVTLESGSLFYIDQNTKDYNSLDDLKNSFLYSPKIQNISEKSKDGEVKLFRIKDSSTKQEIPLFINDKKPIYKRDNYYENQKSEVEKSRKLLFNSKNKYFIKMFLNNEILRSTANFSINISNQEYQFALKKGIPTYTEGQNYYLNIINLFNFASQNPKIGLLRNAFEDSLDLWKNRMMNLDEVELYFYSRNLRTLQNEYYKRLKKNFEIKNLNLRNDNLISFLTLGNKHYNTNTLENIKIKKIA